MTVYNEFLERINKVENTDIRGLLIESLKSLSESYDLEDWEESQMCCSHLENMFKFFKLEI